MDGKLIRKKTDMLNANSALDSLEDFHMNLQINNDRILKNKKNSLSERSYVTNSDLTRIILSSPTPLFPLLYLIAIKYRK